MDHSSKCLLAFLAAVPLAGCQSAIDIRPKQDPSLTAAEEAKRNAYDLGKSYLVSQHYGLALDAFRRDMHENGESVPTLNGLAIVYDKLGRHDLAKKYYDRALALGPSPITLSNIAYSHYLQGKYDKASTLAVQVQELAVEEGPDIAPVVHDIAEATLAKATEEQARQLAEESVLEERAAAPAQPAERSPSYSVQRVGVREWELTEDATPQEVQAFYQPRIEWYGVSEGAEEESIASATATAFFDPYSEPSGMDFLTELALAYNPAVEAHPDMHAVPVSQSEPEMRMAAGAEVELKGAVETIPEAEAEVEMAARKEIEPVAEAEPERSEPQAVRPMYCVRNGTGRPDMARRMANFVSAVTEETPRVANANHYGYETSVITYAPGYEQEAQDLAKTLPFPVSMKEQEGFRANVELILGADLLPFDSDLEI